MPSNQDQKKDKKKPGPKWPMAHQIGTYHEFVRFMACPEPMREKEFGYSTAGEFAKQFKVNPGTLSGWKEKPQFWKDIDATFKKWGMERTPNVIMGLYRNAVKKGQAAEAKFWMQLFHGWKEKTDTDDETRKTLQQIRDGIRAVVDKNTKK